MVCCGLWVVFCCTLGVGVGRKDAPLSTEVMPACALVGLIDGAVLFCARMFCRIAS